MKTEKIKLVFWDWEGRKNDMFPNNHRADEIKEFRIGKSDDFSYWILEGWTWSAWFKVLYEENDETKSDEYRDSENHLSLYDVYEVDKEWCFYALSCRLRAINKTKDPYASLLFEAYDWPENPIMSYTYIDDDHGKLLVYYPSQFVPWAKDDIEAVVSKKDLFEAFYIGFIEQIIKYYDWVKWFFDNDGYFWSKEANLYTFFDRDIDNYLREHGVKDIDEKVQKAKDRIKADLWKIYEEWDRLYNKKDED